MKSENNLPILCFELTVHLKTKLWNPQKVNRQHEQYDPTGCSSWLCQHTIPQVTAAGALLLGVGGDPGARLPPEHPRRVRVLYTQALLGTNDHGLLLHAARDAEQLRSGH